jgi:DNA-binding transcriptional regulator YiaG
MPNIASVLKAEIVRLARKELRGQVDALRKSQAASRAEVLALKRRVGELEKAIKQAQRTGARAARASVPPASDDVEAGRLRFRAAGMASNRRRLGLSAADFGLLVGASGQSVYAWEQGKAAGISPPSRPCAASASARSRPGWRRRRQSRSAACRRVASGPRDGLRSDANAITLAQSRAPTRGTAPADSTDFVPCRDVQSKASLL